MTRTRKLGLLITAALPLFAFARAQAATPIEEVVVTAERRPDTLFSVPASVSAVTGDQLKNLGITNMKSVVQMIPNVVLPNDPENFETYINIRGIRQVDINAEPNFGFFRNGIYDGGERTNLGNLVDVSRIEVLRGPQSGLYGRDAVGGVVNVVYATPTLDHFGGYGIASYGRYDRSELQGAINIPLTDRFAVRATGWWFNQNEGQLYNPTLNRYIDQNSDRGGRVGALWEVTPNLTVNWEAELEDSRGPSRTTLAPNGIANPFKCCGFPISQPETLSTIRRNTPNTEHWQQFYLSQDINYDTRSWLGSFELQTSYRNYHLNLIEDNDQTPFDPTSGPAIQQTAQIRKESLNNYYVNLLWRSPAHQTISWIGGVDYFNEHFGFVREFPGSVDFNLLNQTFAPGFTYMNLLCSAYLYPYDGGCAGLPGVPAGGSFPYYVPNIGVQTAVNAFGTPGSYIDTRSLSAFGSVTYNVNDALSVIGTLRWSQDTKELNYGQGALPSLASSATAAAYLGPLFSQIFYPFQSHQSPVFVHISPSVTVQYLLNQNVNLYALYSTGFRSGGFNLGTSTPAYLSYRPETDSNYEVGAKTKWLGGRLFLDGDFFYMLQNNLVEPETDTSEPAFLFLYYLKNVGKARTYGLELSSQYQATDWWNFGVSVGWLDAKYTEGVTEGTSIVGQNIPLTRNWTVNLNSHMAYPLDDGTKLLADVNWRLEYGGWLVPSQPPTYALNTTPYSDFNDLDVDVGMSFGNKRIVAYLNNAFNDVIWQFQYANGGANVNYGRTYGLRFEINF
ncbi:MAG: TonB-dependent receptor [Alphaproteobacteria bacterium]|nr:TonB-dependent receptor [Alphaproteobacteria bacterium]